MYRVQPITKSAGFIELINGDTLSIITDIKNYLLEKRNNKNGLHDFIKSVAVSTILVYIFGIGDRHKENILITNDGLLVDIDFGFLEGQDTMRCSKINFLINLKLIYKLIYNLIYKLIINL